MSFRLGEPGPRLAADGTAAGGDEVLGGRNLGAGRGQRLGEPGLRPLLLLLHGFPECWYSWRHQLTALAAEGFHAVAPDQRGYARSAAPDAVEDYTLLHLVGDALGVLDAVGGPVTNPVGSFAIKHHHLYEHPAPTIGPIGDDDHPLLAEEGQRREQHPGISGGAAPSDYGTPGSLEGDASNIGGSEGEDF